MSGNDGEGREEGRQAEIGLKYRSWMEGGHGWAGEGGLIRRRWGGGGEGGEVDPRTVGRAIERGKAEC